jgi:DNA-binding MarR family transcriptional regulator
MPAPLSATPCACAGIRRASRAIGHLYDQVLVPTHLKSAQFMILRAIADSGEIAHCDLAGDLVASVETLSRRLARARKAGLVQVHSGERNKRMYSLTAKGKRVLEEATPYWEAAQARLKRSLSDDDWQRLLSFTRRVAAAALRDESLPLANGHGVTTPTPRRKSTAALRLL